MENEKEWLDIAQTFTELTLQHRNEEAIVFIGDILKQIPLRVYLLPNIITLLLQKDSELYNNELKPFFFYIGVFLSKTTTLKESVHQLMYYLFSNDLYERNFAELLKRYEKFIVGKDERSFPLLMVFGSVLHYIDWEQQLTQYKESGYKNRQTEEKLDRLATMIEYKLNSSLSFFPNLEFIIKPLLKTMIYLKRTEECYLLLLAFIHQYPLNPFGYTLLGSFLIEHKPHDTKRIIFCYRNLLKLDPISNPAFTVLTQYYYNNRCEESVFSKPTDTTIPFNEIFKLYIDRISYFSTNLEIWKLFYYFLKDHFSNYPNVLELLNKKENNNNNNENDNNNNSNENEDTQNIKFQFQLFLEKNFNDYQDTNISQALFKFKTGVYFLLTNSLEYTNQTLSKKKNFQLSLNVYEFLESEMNNLKNK
ncbi:hypothetical protein DICPUDRAFT_148328 [Dictyostelium purpureum]|uniref:Uncharacterized protein n=1 Tax=Dictyostelium purpureum TaxID=5786 RepID=F0ZAU4_DICPU|nr:uncharacterized protein DICPUDRAFT_148328 [Dictyostelium purpureum]EGC38980.1 hypothetical protein DICPUDRAFT_148328 [Dictyostelium purpureum]|eukprot:XP_003284545.1 hypothetical protein DICPUDRAFT_148328 [Dictyostelium purpureum]